MKSDVLDEWLTLLNALGSGEARYRDKHGETIATDPIYERLINEVREAWVEAVRAES